MPNQVDNESLMCAKSLFRKDGSQLILWICHGEPVPVVYPKHGHKEKNCVQGLNNIELRIFSAGLPQEVVPCNYLDWKSKVDKGNVHSHHYKL